MLITVTVTLSFKSREFSGKPQIWEQAHVGFGGRGRNRKGPGMKQCAWVKHGVYDTRLAEACPPKLRNTQEVSEYGFVYGSKR